MAVTPFGRTEEAFGVVQAAVGELDVGQGAEETRVARLAHQRSHCDPALGQLFGDVRPEEAGAAGDEDGHAACSKLLLVDSIPLVDLAAHELDAEVHRVVVLERPGELAPLEAGAPAVLFIWT